MQVIVYKNNDDTISIVRPAEEYLLTHTLEDLIKKDVPQDTDYLIIDDNLLPQDKWYRSAWRRVNDKVEIDLNLAKQLHLNDLRTLRNSLLKKQDIQFQIALEKDDKILLQEVISIKQQLRDMPEEAEQEMQQINSVEQLKQYVPNILKDEQ